jgi:aldehyde:ferredoxin oxidoreductase
VEHDVLPKRLMTILDTGPTEGSIPDMDLMLKEFYGFRGVNEEGVAEKRVLEELGLTELAKLLHDG